MEAVGICASDLKCYHGAAKFWGDENRPAWAETMVIPGHEFVGRVVELDDEAASRWGIAVGDRVVSEQIVPCWECRYCKRGQYHMCQPHDLYGFKRRTPGAMASYMVYPVEALVYKISGDIPPLTRRSPSRCPARCTPSSARRSPSRTQSWWPAAARSGSAWSRAHAPRTRCTSSRSTWHPTSSNSPRSCGADITINIAEQDAEEIVKDLTDGYGADVYLEGTGHPSAVPQGLNPLRKLGRYVEYGVFGSDVSVDWSIISDDKELDVLGAHLGPYCWPAAIKMIESGVLPMDEICTHQLPLTEFQKGLDLVASGKESVKVSLIPA